MSVIKLTAALLCGFILVLSLLFYASDDPDVELYRETMEMLMHTEGLRSRYEVEEHYPDLKTVRLNLEQISRLSQSLLRRRQNPAPQISAEETQSMNVKAQLLRQLRQEVNTVLTNFLAGYPNPQP